jgi:hypothetical protein
VCRSGSDGAAVQDFVRIARVKGLFNKAVTAGELESEHAPRELSLTVGGAAALTKGELLLALDQMTRSQKHWCNCAFC